MKLPVRAFCGDCLQPIETYEEVRQIITPVGWSLYVHASHERPRLKIVPPGGLT